MGKGTLRLYQHHETPHKRWLAVRNIMGKVGECLEPFSSSTTSKDRFAVGGSICLPLETHPLSVDLCI